jgi:hypothetical protein
MKYLVFSLILSFPILSSHAQVRFISESDARSVAKNFYYERINQYEELIYEQTETGEVLPVGSDGAVLYYAVNMNSKGFVLVSGIRSVVPVLGYSFESQYDESEKPCNFRSWMGHYQTQIKYCIDQHISGGPEIDQAWEHLLTNDPKSPAVLKGERDVEPMLVSTWNQDYPYNISCPADPGGPHGHCLAGCVTTAMGQLLYYYRWPLTGTGSYSYIHPDYGEISADFSTATYDWEQMTNATDVPNQAIGELLFHLGVSVDMDYGPTSSGMWNHKAAYSLKTYFKYSPETQYVFRDSTSMDWDSLVMAHLDRAMPCYYAGWADYTYTSGHAFVVDGYQGEDYFHMNWGWGGSYDGYFYLDNLTPGGSNFNYAQELIINSFPDTVNWQYPVHCEGPDTLIAPAGSLGDGSGPVYPYSPGAGCSWLIDPQTVEDSITDITLSFHRFNTSADDTLSVYDGETVDAPLLGSFAGDAIPGAVTSSGNKMLITFSSNDTMESEGWFLTYATTSPVWCSGVTMLTDDFGSFSDGSGSFNYKNNSLCQWRIMPAGADHIELEFVSFNTEEGEDFVKVYDLQNQTLLGQYSGPVIPEPVFCPSGKMLIMFSTDEQNTAAGWEAWYQIYINGITSTGRDTSLQVYPVPASGKLFVRFEDRADIPKSIELINLTGQLILRYNPDQAGKGNNIEIDITGVPKGSYILKAIMNQQQVCKKVIIY